MELSRLYLTLGTLLERYETGAFGELQSQAPQARHQYTGEYWDADARLETPTTQRYASLGSNAAVSCAPLASPGSLWGRSLVPRTSAQCAGRLGR